MQGGSAFPSKRNAKTASKLASRSNNFLTSGIQAISRQKEHHRVYQHRVSNIISISLETYAATPCGKNHFVTDTSQQSTIKQQQATNPPRWTLRNKSKRSTDRSTTVSKYTKSRRNRRNRRTRNEHPLVMLCSQVFVVVFHIRIVASSDEDQSIPLLVVQTKDVTARACPSN